MSAEYAATIEALDQNVGRLFHALQQRGLADDTLIVFTADNGGTPDNVAPLNGSKGSLYDGGLRVPTFVWSRGIRSPGRKSDTPITSTDFFPTVLEMAGLPAPKDQLLDGMSLVAEFCGRRLPDRDLFWHFPCYIGRGSPSSAIRRGNHKLIQWYEDERIELFDLASDPGEQNNLADSSPQLTDSMQAALRRWQVQTAAALPSGQNPDYDPTASSRGKGRSQRSKAN
jgi:arylsulfatase A-like enzyme